VGSTPRRTDWLTVSRNVASASDKKQKLYKIKQKKIFVELDKAKRFIENTRGLNLAAVRNMTVQVTRLPK
jgi:hypothetical protein